MRRRETFWILMVVLIVIAIAGGVILNVREARHQEYCRCLDRHPYIMAKYTGDRCLLYVLDPLNEYGGAGMVSYLYSVQEFCKGN